MAIAVASTSSAGTNTGTSLSISAPTGIQEGDLLLILVSNGFNSVATCTGFTTAQTEFFEDPGPSNTREGTVTILYKYALVADESATTYSISCTDDDLGAAYMMRITGAVTLGNPIFQSHSGEAGISQSGGLAVSESVSLIRPTSSLSIIYATAWSNGSFVGEITNSGYTLTTADGNPTWNEINEINFQYRDPLNDWGRLAVAYATSTDNSDITNYSFNYVEVSLDDPTWGGYGLITLMTPQDASGSNTLTTTTAETFDGSGVTNVSAANVLATATGVAPTQTGRGEAPTQWTNETKPSTTWTNET